MNDCLSSPLHLSLFIVCQCDNDKNKINNIIFFTNTDSVVRTVYYKYFHPKEVLISNGVLNRWVLVYIQTFVIRATKGHTQMFTLYTCLGVNGMTFGISGIKWTVHNRKVQRCKPLEILTLETPFCSCPIKNHCNTLSYNHKLTQSPNYNMGVAQTLVQIFTWITRHQNYLWHTCKIATESVLWLTKYGIFGKNGLTVIQNRHCNRKLKIYLNLPCIWKIWWPPQERFVLCPKTRDFFQIIWECWYLFLSGVIRKGATILSGKNGYNDNQRWPLLRVHSISLSLLSF